MKITNLVLQDSIKLQVSRIKSIKIDTSNTKTQLVIGSNGSGKSSLLHELFPFPPIKSTFGKNGYKNLTIMHNGEEYNLIYDAHHGHSFMHNHVNLNKNRNFDTQKELIEKYFQLNSNIHTILKCSLPICDMTPAQRKRFIFDVNPVDISLFIERHKKVRKDVTSYSNNLDRLYERHKQLISQKLPSDQLDTLLATRAKLENQEKTLLVWITKVTEELNRYTTNDIEYDIDNTRHILRQLYHSLPDYFNISRDSYKNDLVELPVKIEMMGNELVDLEKLLEDLTNSISYYENQKNKVIGEYSEILSELTDLQSKVSTYTDKNLDTIPETSIQDMYKLSDKVRILIIRIFDISTRIIKRDKLNALYEQLTEDRMSITQLTSEISQIDKRIDELNSSIKSYTTADDCTKSSCELFKVYNASITKKQTELDELYTSIKAKRKCVIELKDKYDHDHNNWDEQSRIWTIIDEIKHLILSSPLRIYFTDESISKQIIKSPMKIYDEIQQYLDRNERYYEYSLIMNRIAELEKVSDLAKSRQQLSDDLINYELSKYTDKFKQLYSKYDNKKIQLASIDNKLKHVNQFERINLKLSELNDTNNVYMKYIEDTANIEYLTKLLNCMNTLLSNIRKELIDIIKISKDQEMLIERLDKEVDSVISELSPKLDLAKTIENALQELPIVYIKTFINDVIKVTNYFISRLATYPMQLIRYDDIPTFEIGVVIDDDVKLKDISSCSDGQKAIIQLCFCLAMIVELKYNDYPIYVDEIDRALDSAHSIRLTKLLIDLIYEEIVSQIFLTNHHQSVFDGTDGDITVLNGDNIVLPLSYNTNTIIEYV